MNASTYDSGARIVLCAAEGISNDQILWLDSASADTPTESPDRFRSLSAWNRDEVRKKFRDFPLDSTTYSEMEIGEYYLPEATENANGFRKFVWGLAGAGHHGSPESRTTNRASAATCGSSIENLIHWRTEVRTKVFWHLCLARAGPLGARWRIG